MLRGVAVVYIIDGRQVGNLEDFWRVMGEAVNGPGGYFGSNLDAFNDCLCGGFGTPRTMILWLSGATMRCPGSTLGARKLFASLS